MPQRPQRETAASIGSNDDITWLERVLFDDAVFVRPLTRRSSSREVASWFALPRRGPTRRLVPVAGRFASESFANEHDAMSSRRRMLGRATRVGVRSGVLAFAPTLDIDADLIFADRDRSVVAAAAEELGVQVAACAITLGPRRYNRKPVVQLMDGEASTVGFLKVGADEATSAMVATEADMVGRLNVPAGSPLVVPAVLWRSTWKGHSVACFSPVGRSNDPRPADSTRLVAVASAVVDAGGGSRTVAFRNSAPLERLRRGSADLSGEHGELIQSVEAVFGDHEVTVGLWHGDFSPWNMISSEHETALIDWEFASTDMPVGSDLLHNRVMVATHLDGEAPVAAVQRLCRRADDLAELHAIGVPPEAHAAHLTLYLLELMRRESEIEQLGLPSTGFGSAPRQGLTHILRQAGRG